MENKNIPRTIEDVCNTLFNGDFYAMVCYAKAYKEGERRDWEKPMIQNARQLMGIQFKI